MAGVPVSAGRQLRRRRHELRGVHVAVLAVSGELDLSGAPPLRDALLDALDSSRGRPVVVDLEGVDFIDSAGLGVLVGGLKRARSSEGELVLVATGRSVLSVLELTGLDRAFTIHPSREAALGVADSAPAQPRREHGSGGGT